MTKRAPPWPRYHGWLCYAAYAVFAALAWFGAARLGWIGEAEAVSAEAGWLSGLFARLPDSAFKAMLAILAIAAIAYALGQWSAARRDRRWLLSADAGPEGWFATLAFARPTHLYRVEGRAAILGHHVDYGLDDALAPLSALLWAFPMLGFLGTIAGLSEAVARLPAALESGEIASVLSGLHLAFDTTMLGLLATLALYPITLWIEQAAAPLHKARMALDARGA